jgi:hypothetical protein
MCRILSTRALFVNKTPTIFVGINEILRFDGLILRFGGLLNILGYISPAPPEPSVSSWALPRRIALP